SKRLEIFDSSKLVYWVENIGDINGDSFDEFVVSTLTNTVQMEGYPTKGLVKIVYGNSDLNNLTIKDISFEETGFTSYNHLYGYRVEPIGDFNGDTYNDFAISIRGDRMKSNHKTGAVAIFYGKQNVDDYVSADTTLYPVGKGSQIMFREFGFNMTSGGDFDGDGIDDIAIVGTQTGLNESIGEILFGGRNERALIYLPNALTFANSSLTTFVSSNYGGIYFVPDVNGDSKDELLITTGFNIFSNAGIIFGTNTTSEVFPTTVFKGFNSFDELGGAYHSAVGNFDGDSKTVEFILPQSIGNVEGFNAGSWSVYQLEKVTTKLDDSNEEIISFELKQNFPNPFNPATTIGFSVPSTSLVSLRIYNSIGQLVETLIQNASYSTGEYTVSFNASKLSSGVYFYELQTGAFKAVKAMTLIK
ncbi:T9SS type A sorting domain-containing protein, partial [bacterium]